MASIYDLRVPDIGAVTPELIEAGIRLAFKTGLQDVAPMGYGGNPVYLFGDDTRASCIRLRNHSSNIELLVTDVRGYFLHVGSLHTGLATADIAQHFHHIVALCSPYILDQAPERKFSKGPKF